MNKFYLLAVLAVLMGISNAIMHTVERKEDGDSMQLAQLSAERVVHHGGGYGHGLKKKPSAFAMFIGGWILIIFSFPVLWFNERKQVRLEAVYGQA
jgi:hypothetical protein